MYVHLVTPHVPTVVRLLMFHSGFYFQNHEQQRAPDTDLINNDADLTFTFGDTAITANGASTSRAEAAGGLGWSANGKRSGSTSEEALEREPDSREQELLSRGTRLVFPMEDHIWPCLPAHPPCLNCHPCLEPTLNNAILPSALSNFMQAECPAFQRWDGAEIWDLTGGKGSLWPVAPSKPGKKSSRSVSSSLNKEFFSKEDTIPLWCGGEK